ncbi:MAG: aspartate/tyrosine/aromatic aminotransferase [Xanthomonadales bacterium]|nr:aspartate/tyrosine/aromatic aminotransferase [Xanthomonadales bacterium]
MLDQLKAIPPDPILGISSAFAKDPNPNRIDLGIGVYRDESGSTPMLQSVVEAEKRMIAAQTSKSYLGPTGVTGFNSAMAELTFGANCEALLAGRIRTVQTPGGTGALRVSAELVKAANPAARIWVSEPTWPNHLVIFPAAGVPVETYPYFDKETSSLRFDDMLSSLRQRGPGDAVLFHACCHNPCGVSPNAGQWEAISDLAAERGFLPVVDLAYQGFEKSLEEDNLAVRLFTQKCPELIVAMSCSKNFAVYRERVGAIAVVAASAQKAADIETNIHSLTRKNYSMPPAHGPAVINVLLHDADLTALWRTEVTTMRNRINTLRAILVEKIRISGIQQDFSFLQRQSGMFSFLGLNVTQVRRLREEFSIYTVDSARANIASFNTRNIDYFVAALGKVLAD